MYATVRSYTTGSEFGDTLVERQSELREVLQGIEGFRAYYLIRTDDGLTTVSVFDDEAGAQESTRAAAAWVAENLPDLNVAPPQVKTGEVELSF